jgi:wyosine [tRNA(Phe)-imidazoG37] synthetase (radical SAM superfamily)
MGANRQHVYGPVPSRRLGRSLGVDLVPFKTCSFNCLYCQVGHTTTLTRERAEYTPVDEVLADVAKALATGPAPDYVTLSGSGEPTLHSKLDEIIRAIRKLTDRPIAVLTNGSLLFEQDVRAACALADLVLPTLAAHDEDTYQRVHRPYPGLTLESHVAGLTKFRAERDTPMWLELFLLEGVNASDDDQAAFARLIGRIAPDRIQINTAVRPTSDPRARAVSAEKLARWARALGPKAEVIAETRLSSPTPARASEADVLELCRRRPCTLDHIAEALGLHRQEAVKHVTQLLRVAAIRAERQGDHEFYVATRS